MAFTKWNYEECKQEHAYIKTVDPRAPGKSFNDDPACFVTYCEMQSKHIADSGFPLLCKDINDARDIAKYKGKRV